MREPGFYWVKLRNSDWSIAEFIIDNISKRIYYEWYIIGCEMVWGDEDFLEIGEKIERNR